MANSNGLDFPSFDFPDTDMELLDDLEPEVVDGPFGIPVVKPRGAPAPPLGGGGDGR